MWVVALPRPRLASPAASFLARSASSSTASSYSSSKPARSTARTMGACGGVTRGAGTRAMGRQAHESGRRPTSAVCARATCRRIGPCAICCDSVAHARVGRAGTTATGSASGGCDFPTAERAGLAMLGGEDIITRFRGRPLRHIHIPDLRPRPRRRHRPPHPRPPRGRPAPSTHPPAL